jgi:hypothetical protein
MLLKSISGTHTCQNEKQGHEPRVENVHHNVLILRAISESANASYDPFVVVEVEYMV